MDATATKLALANYALIKIGAKTITSLTDANQPNAVIINGIYPECREFLLEECPWSFAVKTVTLATNVVTLPDFGDGVNICYVLPADYLKIYQISIPRALIRFEIVSGFGYCMLSDTAGILAKYTFNNDDPTTYSAKFYEALACRLAMQACFKISDASQYAQKLSVDYDKAFMTAAAEDGQIASPDQINQDQWLFARLAGSNAVVGYPNGQIGLYPTGVQDF